MATRTKAWQVPKVIFQPQVSQGMQRGINQVCEAIRPTLGPLHRTVAVESTLRRDKLPELLDDGGVIARRIIQLQDRQEDVGAMFVRHMLWQLHEKAGDGTATAAVIFQEIYNRGLRYRAAGGCAQRLRLHLEQGAGVVLEALDRMAVPLQGKEHLTCLAETLCADAELAGILGEVFTVIGEYGRLDIRTGSKAALEIETYDGMFWEGGLLRRGALAAPPGHGPGASRHPQVQLENAAVVIGDLEVEDPAEAVHLLRLAAGLGATQVLLVAQKVSDRAMAVLLEKTNRAAVAVTAVKTPGLTGPAHWAALQDLAVLTGGQPLVEAAGASLLTLRPGHLGWARRAWADADHFGISGGRGDPEAVRQHVSSLQRLCSRVEASPERKQLLERVGRLAGGAATLWVGDSSPLARERRRALAERTAQAMQNAIRKGVVPGGGAAYRACTDRLRSEPVSEDNEEKRAAYCILTAALQAPMRTLLANAGCDTGEIRAQIERAGPSFGFDLRSGQVVDMLQAGIVDSAAVARAVVYAAVHSAALALTTDVLVHRRNPPEALASP